MSLQMQLVNFSGYTQQNVPVTLDGPGRVVQRHLTMPGNEGALRERLGNHTIRILEGSQLYIYVARSVLQRNRGSLVGSCVL